MRTLLPGGQGAAEAQSVAPVQGGGEYLSSVDNWRRVAERQEQHSYPIFRPDWGADEELLLISGLMKDGLGNWAEAAVHIGTRTKEDCERHYLDVYLGVGPDGEDLVKEENGEPSDAEPPRKKQRRAFMPVRHLAEKREVRGLCLPDQPMDMDIKVNYEEFQEEKRERIEELRKPHGELFRLEIN